MSSPMEYVRVPMIWRLRLHYCRHGCQPVFENIYRGWIAVCLYRTSTALRWIRVVHKTSSAASTKCCSTPCHGHTPTWTHYTVLRRLHWLPLCQRVCFKLAGFVFQSLASLAPPYLADHCHLASFDRHLRSADIRNCVVPQTNTRFGDRSFSTSGQKVWNSLPSARRLKFCCV